MSDFIESTTKSLETVISDLADNPSLFLRNPSADFSRNRKIDFNVNAPTVSAYTQQRSKVLPEAFEFIFHEFNLKNQSKNKKFDGYQLLACDGSNLSIASNPKDLETAWKHNQFGGITNHLHLNAFYDVLNRVYTDAFVQTASEYHEHRACIRMLERSTEEKSNNSFDTDIDITLTRKQSKAMKQVGYKFMPTVQTFDYLPIGSSDDYPLSFRIVRFKITENSYELVITNLDRFRFPPNKLKEIYQLRWGIETSFRELKYAIGLTSFHSKKVDYIKQEIFARLTLYNYCELITSYVVEQSNISGKTKQVNFTIAIYICREYLRRKRQLSPPDVIKLIEKHTLPVRPGRRDPRKVKAQASVSFLYRVA